MTGPRLPLEKSYCLRMVLGRFTTASFARRDQSDTVLARCVNNYQDSPKRIHPQSDEASLSLRIWILNCHRRRIAKGLLGVGEANLVFGEIRPSLRGIEFDLHRVIMHIVCILSSAGGCSGLGRLLT